MQEGCLSGAKVWTREFGEAESRPRSFCGQREGLEGLRRSPSRPQNIPAAELLCCPGKSSAQLWPGHEISSPARAASWESVGWAGSAGPALPSPCLGQGSTCKVPSTLSPHHDAPQQLPAWARPWVLLRRCRGSLPSQAAMPEPRQWLQGPCVCSFGVVPYCFVALLPCHGVLHFGQLSSLLVLLLSEQGQGCSAFLCSVPADELNSPCPKGVSAFSVGVIFPHRMSQGI